MTRNFFGGTLGEATQAGQLGGARQKAQPPCVEVIAGVPRASCVGVPEESWGRVNFCFAA